MRAPRTSIVVLLAIAACGGGGGSSTADTDATDGSTSSATSAPTTTDAIPCTPGTEGCSCDAGACDAGLACWSNVCVMPPAAESSGDIETTTQGESTSTSDDTTTGGEETSESSSDDGEDSSTTAPALPCLEGNNVCQDGMLETCVGGEVQLSSCEEQCALIGYDSPGCLDANACTCGNFTDEACIEIAMAGCACYEAAWGGGVCDAGDIAFWYDTCFDEEANNHELVLCIGAGVLAEPDACADIVDACLG